MSEVVEFETDLFVGKMQACFKLEPKDMCPRARELMAGKKRLIWVSLQVGGGALCVLCVPCCRLPLVLPVPFELPWSVHTSLLNLTSSTHQNPTKTQPIQPKPNRNPTDIQSRAA
jgi:hypothetical protein